MQSTAATPEEYISSLPAERQPVMHALRAAVLKHLPEGFVEGMVYGMLGYTVPHMLYPAGYHCDPKQALPYMNIASQKNYISVYHMGLYADEQIMQWFISAYAKVSSKKPDIGKSCIRFKKVEDIPVDLIGELAGKMTVQDWIALYESKLKSR